jgi:hypothetical protein
MSAPDPLINISLIRIKMTLKHPTMWFSPFFQGKIIDFSDRNAVKFRFENPGNPGKDHLVDPKKGRDESCSRSLAHAAPKIPAQQKTLIFVGESQLAASLTGW